MNMKKNTSLIVMFLFISSIGFAQKQEANLPKGEVYINPVFDVTGCYKTTEIIIDKNSNKWKKQDKYLFSTGKYKSNTIYKHQSTNIKLPVLSSKNGRINLHIIETYELESYYDEGKVLVSDDKGASWQVVSVRSGKSGSRTTVVNLTNYAGKNILIAFELKTDNSNNYDGWTIESAVVKTEVTIDTVTGSRNQVSSRPSVQKSVPMLKAGSASIGLSGNFTSLESRNFPYKISLLCEINHNGMPTASLDSSNFTVYEKIDSLWLYDTTWAQGVQYVDYRNSLNAPLQFRVKPPDSTAINKYVDVVFLMDNSGSMSGEQAAVKTNVQNFLDSLQAKGIKAQIGLIRFGQSTDGGMPLVVKNNVGSWWTNYGTSTTYDIDAFKTMWTNTNTVNGSFEPSYDALMKGIKTGSYSFAPGAQKVFVLITDEAMTNNNASGSNYTDSTIVINALKSNGVTVYSLSLNQEPHLSDFESIAKGTGGKFYNITSPFDDILDDIAAQVSNKYEILYPPTRPVYDGLKRNAEIEVIYKGDTLLLTGKDYTPGEAPKIALTEQTLDTLHASIPFLKDSIAPVQVYVYDYDAPRPHNGGNSRYVKLYYRSVDNTTGSYYELSMSCDSIFGVGDTTIWSANIPGIHVQPPGIEYYITASDSVTTTPSPILPVQYLWTFAVTPNYPPQLKDSTAYADAATANLMEKKGYKIGDSITFKLYVRDTTVFVEEAYIYISDPSNPQYSPEKLNSVGNGIYTKTFKLSGGDTKYFFMATDNYGVSSWLASEFNPFVIKTEMIDPSYRHDINLGGGPPPPFWNSTIQWLEQNLVAGDSIKIYVDDIFGEKCIGTKAYNIKSFRVNGDDPNVAGKDGFYLNDKFIFKIYKASTGKIYEAEVTYKPGCDTSFQNNGVSDIESIIVYGHKSILSYEDNWWSTYAKLKDKSFDVIFEDVLNDIDMVKDHLGNTWIPGSLTNTLTTYVPGYGYEVSLKPNKWPLNVVTFGKQRTYSNETPTIRVYKAYTFVGCPYSSGENLANIAGANTETGAITKLENGNYYAYYPQYMSSNTWTTDCNMYPGTGYKVTTYGSSEFNFSFPSPTGTIKSTSIAGEYTDAVTYPQRPRSSNEFMHLLLPGKAWGTPPSNGDMVKAYSKSGELIGQNYVFNNGTSMLIDGLDLAKGEAFEIRYENSESGEQTSVIVKKWELGNATYEPNKMAVAADIEPMSIVKSSTSCISSLNIYPNPAKDKVNAIVELASATTITVKLTDATGATVYHSPNTEYAQGSHIISIPAKFGSGMYSLTVSARNGNSIIKQVVIK
jgi:hypothetical protein